MDSGHAFVYLKDSSGKVVAILSFGPGGNITLNFRAFLNNQLPGDAHWRLQGDAHTWESNLTNDQLAAGEKAITDFKGNVPKYTADFNCATAALSIATKVGLTLPSGVGPAYAGGFGGKVNVANPYNLHQQMTERFGPPEVVSTSTFPKP